MGFYCFLSKNEQNLVSFQKTKKTCGLHSFKKIGFSQPCLSVSVFRFACFVVKNVLSHTYFLPNIESIFSV